MHTPPALLLAPCRMRGAQYIHCARCGVIGSICDPVPWRIGNTKWMHESGIGSMQPGHKVRYMRVIEGSTN